MRKKPVPTATIVRLPAEKWNPARLKRTLAQFRRRRILILGDVGVDRYTEGAVERISPEAPVPIVRVEREQLKLGLAANVADNVRSLGGTPLLVGLVGRDRCADDLAGLLRARGISASHLVRDGSRRTVLKERIVSDRQQLLRVDYEDAGSPKPTVQRAILARVKRLLPSCDLLVLQDYAKGLIDPELARSVFALAHAAGVPVFADPNSRTPLDWYRGADLIKPNRKETERLTGVTISDDRSLIEAGSMMIARTRAGSLILTLGRDGMAILRASEEGGVARMSLIPTFAQEVYDVSGAGDTALAVIALAAASKASLEDAAILGNLASGVVVGKRGTATVTPAEVLAALSRARGRD